LAVMYDFINLSCNIAAAPFPSGDMGFSWHSAKNLYEYVRNVLSCLQRFAHDKRYYGGSELGRFLQASKEPCFIAA
jgi:hypothetical protein